MQVHPLPGRVLVCNKHMADNTANPQLDVACIYTPAYQSQSHVRSIATSELLPTSSADAAGLYFSTHSCPLVVRGSRGGRATGGSAMGAPAPTVAAGGATETARGTGGGCAASTGANGAEARMRENRPSSSMRRVFF